MEVLTNFSDSKTAINSSVCNESVRELFSANSLMEPYPVDGTLSTMAAVVQVLFH